MALTLLQQFSQALSQTRSILVVLRPQPSYDEITASIAIADLVRKSGKLATIVSHDFKAPNALKFLSNTDQILGTVGHLQDFSVSVDVGAAGVESVTHEIVDGRVVLHITPRTGTVTADAVQTQTSDFRFDAIITVGVPDLTSLGKTYTENTALFTAVPIINIDRAPSNEYFGHINLVEITCTSVSEIVHAIFDRLHITISPVIAQTLLTGMIAATQSFREQSVNARTLQTASALIGLGADREQVVHNLYRQRSIAALKLWGAVLSHLQTDPQQPLMWSSITREDFVRAGATENDLADLIDELIHTAPNAKVFALIYERPEKPGELAIVIDAQRPYLANALASGFTKPIGTPARTHAVLEHYTLGDGTQRVVNVLRAKMRG